jgi:hypothetical protein
MEDPDARSEAARLLDRHPRLRALMDASPRFRRLAARKRIEIDGTASYVYRGDALGGLDDLFVDALVRGAAPQTPDADARALFEEVDPDLRSVIENLLDPSKERER